MSGRVISRYTRQIPPLVLDREALNATLNTAVVAEGPATLQVPPHVLATPAIVSIEDGYDALVVAVSYYFDK